jgi:uncharacterized protein YaiI (UPF0178 family)
MTRRIMDRTQGRPGITVILIFGLILLAPARTEASKISSSDTSDALREMARASSSPLSNSTIVAILNAGAPVSETTTTTFSDGTTQTADLEIVPNTSTGTVTITKEINLADGETEKVVDVATVSGGSTTNIVTTTLPDRSLETKDETDVTKGDKTIISGTVSMPGGGIHTIKGQTVQRGSESVTSLAITNPAGQVYHDRITITHNSDLSRSETNTTRGPGGSISTVTSVTNTVLNASEMGQSAALAGLDLPAPKVAAQVPGLLAQVLASPTVSGNADPSPLAVPLPEPSTLVVFGLLLGVAGLRYRFNARRR